MKNFIQKFAAKCEYPDIRIWANPLICSKIAKYPISESIIIYPIGVANARNIPKYPLGYGHGLYPTFRNRGTAYNSRSFSGNLLFVGDYYGS